MPGTRMFGGFYTARFQLGEAVGHSVMHAGAGKMLGGNSAFAHIGTYEDLGGEIAIKITTVRHNPDPNYPAMAGTDNETPSSGTRACETIGSRIYATATFWARSRSRTRPSIQS